MSANKQRRAGTPAFPKRRPELRLVKNPDERLRPAPDPELKEIFNDMRRIRRERVEREPDDKDVA